MVFKGALLGAGNIADNHMKGYLKDGRAKITWVCDSNLERAKQVAEKYGIEKTTANYHECLEDKTLDFVDILTPNFLHKPMSIPAKAAEFW